LRGKKRKPRRRRRTQADILLSVLRYTPSKQPASINEIAKKSGLTWRTTKKNIEALRKIGVVKVIKQKGKKRLKYKRI